MMSEKHKEILSKMDRKYVAYLEDLKIREHELSSKDHLDFVELLELMSIRAQIKAIADALGIPYEVDLEKVSTQPLKEKDAEVET
ncbi:MAG: phage portal protein [Sulfolobales archaeon]|nr:phage portal protein [Sulfolobales archaeon]MCX8199652.1 phage portal protein [Sulfolobales archaeon]MDW8170606.1 hypothetical protein [Desulfurococcaceae archaeon]